MVPFHAAGRDGPPGTASFGFDSGAAMVVRHLDGLGINYVTIVQFRNHPLEQARGPFAQLLLNASNNFSNARRAGDVAGSTDLDAMLFR